MFNFLKIYSQNAEIISKISLADGQFKLKVKTEHGEGEVEVPVWFFNIFQPGHEIPVKYKTRLFGGGIKIKFNPSN